MPLNQFIPNFFFRYMDPLSLNLDDTTTGTSNPRDVFWDFNKFDSFSDTRLTHPVAKKRWFGTTD